MPQKLRQCAASSKSKNNGILYTIFEAVKSAHSAAIPANESFQHEPQNRGLCRLERPTGTEQHYAAKCHTSCTYGFHLGPIASKLGQLVVRQQRTAGKVSRLCTIHQPSCRQTAQICSSPAGLYTTLPIHACGPTRPVPWLSVLPEQALPTHPLPVSLLARLHSSSRTLLAHTRCVAKGLDSLDVAAVTTLIKYSNRGTLE